MNVALQKKWGNIIKNQYLLFNSPQYGSPCKLFPDLICRLITFSIFIDYINFKITEVLVGTSIHLTFVIKER